MNVDRTPPSRSVNSRHTHVVENRIVHIVDDSQYEQELNATTEPDSVLGFVQRIVGWYESDVDHQDELPLFAEVTEDGCVYIRDNQGGEWVMWSVDEWANKSHSQSSSAETAINTSITRSMLNAVVLAYEYPSEIKQRHSRVQIESC